MSGVVIGIEPVVARMGPFSLRWSSFLLVLAVLFGLGLTIRNAKRAGFSVIEILDAASWALLAGLIGARLLHIMEYGEHYLTRPADIIDLAAGGLSVWGGLLAGGLTIWALCRRRGWSFGLLADAAVPGLIVGEALGRVGAFIDGAGQGQPADLPWATQYQSANALAPDQGVPRHPAQAYQVLADGLIMGLLWLLRDARLPVGARFWLAAGLYGLSRLAIGMVGTGPPLLLGLQWGQAVGFGVALGSAFVIIRTVLRRRRVPCAAPR